MTIHGRLEDTPTGRDLVVVRELPVGLDEAWRWVTTSERTERWYGPFTGDARPGGVVEVTMSAEEGSPTSGFRIDECHPPADGSAGVRLASTGEPPFDWVVALELEQQPGAEGTSVALRHVAIPGDIPLADLGAGWEFYLDALVAAVEGREGRTFEQCVADVGTGYAAL